jgi:hypothetical protein
MLELGIDCKLDEILCGVDVLGRALVGKTTRVLENVSHSHGFFRGAFPARYEVGDGRVEVEELAIDELSDDEDSPRIWLRS